SGYCGGTEKNPAYLDVVYGRTSHLEAVKVTFDPALVSYDKILYHFWRNIDPLDAAGQFCDKGNLNLKPQTPNPKSRPPTPTPNPQSQTPNPGWAIETEVLPMEGVAGNFWLAEDYHQDYYLKNPNSYAYYKKGCGRVDPYPLTPQPSTVNRQPSTVIPNPQHPQPLTPKPRLRAATVPRLARLEAHRLLDHSSQA
ncbi:peptide methionine sulfoxide reductase MsrA, partial [Baffinella frigidus]